jgi:hypothetical protein
MKVLIALLLLAVPAHAMDCPRQDYTKPDKQPNYDCPSPGENSMVPRINLKASVELKKQAKAPWTGILLDTNRVLLLGLRIKALRRIRWVETIQFQERRTIEKEYLVSQHKVEKAFLVKQRDNWKQQALDAHKALESRYKWYNSKALWFATGVVVTAAAATALAFGLRE